jgi:putative transposase
MPRGPRFAPGGMIFHVLNRANRRQTLFGTRGDYQAFVRVVVESLLVVPTRILAYCLMPNHWHFVLWPREDGELSSFLHQVTTTHVRRWHKFRDTVGHGHVYQGPFKSFPVQEDDHYYRVCRYVERNASRANLVDRADDWVWGSAWARSHHTDPRIIPLSDWPLPMSQDWNQWLNEPITEAELRAIRTCVRRGRPYGERGWQRKVAKQLGLEFTLRSPGRPRCRR